MVLPPRNGRRAGKTFVFPPGGALFPLRGNRRRSRLAFSFRARDARRGRFISAGGSLSPAGAGEEGTSGGISDGSCFFFFAFCWKGASGRAGFATNFIFDFTIPRGIAGITTPLHSLRERDSTWGRTHGCGGFPRFDPRSDRRRVPSQAVLLANSRCASRGGQGARRAFRCGS